MKEKSYPPASTKRAGGHSILWSPIYVADRLRCQQEVHSIEGNGNIQPQ